MKPNMTEKTGANYRYQRNYQLSDFADRTILNTPVPLVSSTIEKKSRSPDDIYDSNRLKRLNYLKKRSSWISNLATPKISRTSPVLEPIAQRSDGDSGNASNCADRRSGESFKSILNLQTMEDLSGSLLDVQMSDIPTLQPTNDNAYFSKDTQSFKACDGDKENSMMPLVGSSPGRPSNPSFTDDVSLDWDEIMRPPSPPNDRKTPKRYDPIPSRLLGRNYIGNTYSDVDSNRERRLESILCSDNSDLSNISNLTLSGSRKKDSLKKSRSPFASNDYHESMKFSARGDLMESASSEHRRIDIGSGFGSIGQLMDHLDKQEEEPESLQAGDVEFRENIVTPSSSWFQSYDSHLKSQMKPYFRERCSSRLNMNEDDTNSIEQLNLSPTHESRLDPGMPSIQEEDALDVTLTDENHSDGHAADVTLSADEEKPISLSLLKHDGTTAAAGKPKGEQAHPLASSTAASLSASSGSSEDVSSLANLSDIRNVLRDELWESHGPSGIASFVEKQVKHHRKSSKTHDVDAFKSRRDTTSSCSTATSTVKPPSHSDEAESYSPNKWAPLQESIKIPPREMPSRLDGQHLLKASSRSTNQLLSSFMSSQATTVIAKETRTSEMVKFINSNNSNTTKVEESGDRTNCSRVEPRRTTPPNRRASHKPAEKSMIEQVLHPHDIDFEGYVYVGTQTEQKFSITNQSKKIITCSIDISYCACDSEQLSQEDAKRTFAVRSSVVIGPQISREIGIIFRPFKSGYYTGELSLTCNNFNSGIPMFVNLTAEAGEACVTVGLQDQDQSTTQLEVSNQDVVNFGVTQWNSSLMRRFSVTNEGEGDLSLWISMDSASKCFAIRSSDDNISSQLEVNIPKHGNAEIDIVCSPTENQSSSSSRDEENPTPLQSTCQIFLQKNLSGASSNPLFSFKLQAVVGYVNLVIPKPYSTIRLDGKNSQCTIPLKNLGSIPMTVRLVLDCPVSAEWLLLQLDTDKKVMITPGSTEFIALSYTTKRGFLAVDEVTATLFIISEPKGSVYEIPIICEPMTDPPVMKMRPPLIATKSMLLWTAVEIGSSEKQQVVLKNTTSNTYSVDLKVEHLRNGETSDEKLLKSGVFLIRDPTTGARCKDLRLNMKPMSNTPVTVIFRAQLPRYFRARLLIRAVSLKTTFIIGLRGYGGRGELLCANSESSASGQLVKLLHSKSSQRLVMYNSGNRSIWTNAKVTGGSVIPSSFLVQPTSAKTVSFVPDDPAKIDEEMKIEFVYGDEIVRPAYKDVFDDCPSMISQGRDDRVEDVLPDDDCQLQWSEVCGAPRTMTLRLTAASDGGEEPATFASSLNSSPLRETMIRVADFDDSLPMSVMTPGSPTKDGSSTKSAVLRTKPHVEEWLRCQQALSSPVLNSNSSSSSSKGQALLKVLTPSKIEFLGLEGFQERTMEWMNVSVDPVRWALTADGPLKCNNKTCTVSDDPFSERVQPWSPFSFSPSCSQRLESASVDRVRVRCGFRQDGKLPSVFLRRHAGCRSGFHQKWTLSAVSISYKGESSPTSSPSPQNQTLTLRVQQSPSVAKQPTPPKARVPHPSSSASSSSSVPHKSRLLVKQKEVLFPLIRVHGQQVERLKITNRSKNPLAVIFRALPEPFRLDLRVPSELVLKPEHCVMLPLVFRPTETGRFQALLIIECSEDADEPPQQVLLIGEASP